jgi:hypothetical protein
VTLDVHQDEHGVITGTARSSNGVTGQASGGVSDRGKIDLVINWGKGSVGDYTGFVGRDGVVQDGQSFDRMHPESRATWTTHVPLRCAD